MKITVDRVSSGHTVRVWLSRRNLRTLLAMLDEPTHITKSIEKDFPAGGPIECHLVITAEEDSDHYAYMEPGRMTPSVEARLSSFLGEKLDNG